MSPFNKGIPSDGRWALGPSAPPVVAGHLDAEVVVETREPCSMQILTRAFIANPPANAWLFDERHYFAIFNSPPLDSSRGFDSFQMLSQRYRLHRN